MSVSIKTVMAAIRGGADVTTKTSENKEIHIRSNTKAKIVTAYIDDNYVAGVRNVTSVGYGPGQAIWVDGLPYTMVLYFDDDDCIHKCRLYDGNANVVAEYQL